MQKVRGRVWYMTACECRRKWCIAGWSRSYGSHCESGQQCVRAHWSLAQCQRHEVSHYCWMALKENTTRLLTVSPPHVQHIPSNKTLTFAICVCVRARKHWQTYEDNVELTVELLKQGFKRIWATRRQENTKQPLRNRKTATITGEHTWVCPQINVNPISTLTFSCSRDAHTELYFISSYSNLTSCQ